jgi:hypothetical protein
MLHKASDLGGLFGTTYAMENGMRFGTRNVMKFCRSVSPVASELAKHVLDLVAVQEVRWEEVVTEPAQHYEFFYGAIKTYWGSGGVAPRIP